jgi:transcriptional regulator with XRE-family HTH domain
MSAARNRKAVDTSTYSGRFAERLRTLREKKKMTVEELAEASGIPTRTLWNWESATSQPIIGQLPQLAQALGVKVGKLMPDE